jgi:hypothetical protein
VEHLDGCRLHVSRGGVRLMWVVWVQWLCDGVAPV